MDPVQRPPTPPTPAPAQPNREAESKEVTAMLHRIQAFINTHKTFEGFPAQVPESAQTDLVSLTNEFRERLKTNTLINFTKLKADIEAKIQNDFGPYLKEKKQMQDMLKLMFGENDPEATEEDKAEMKAEKNNLDNIPLSQMMFDSGDLTKRIEAALALHQEALKETTKIVDFMNSTEIQAPEGQPLPLMSAFVTAMKLMELNKAFPDPNKK